jgi:hypothetical protein
MADGSAYALVDEMNEVERFTLRLNPGSSSVVAHASYTEILRYNLLPWFVGSLPGNARKCASRILAHRRNFWFC